MEQKMWKYASAAFERRDVVCQNCFMVMGFIHRKDDSIEYIHSASTEVSRESRGDDVDRVNVQCELCGAILQLDLPKIS
jgi:hypothetical protein